MSWVSPTSTLLSAGEIEINKFEEFAYERDEGLPLMYISHCTIPPS